MKRCLSKKFLSKWFISKRFLANRFLTKIFFWTGLSLSKKFLYNRDFYWRVFFRRDLFQAAFNITHLLMPSYEGRKFLHQKCITFCQFTLYDDKLPFLFFPCSICIWMNRIESKFWNVFNIQEKQDLHITSSYLKFR